jgi:hypothetical protein
MVNQFFMTLPSNSKQGNTSATFETYLPININLEGDWDVGLAEIIYANTWHNVSGEQNMVRFYDAENNIRQIIYIPPARYESVKDLLHTIQTSIDIVSTRDKINYGKMLLFSYNDLKKTVQFTVLSDVIKNVKLSPHLLYMLGFLEDQLKNIDYKQKKLTLNANHPPDMTGGMHYLYVYCDIAQPQIVGNVLSPLLEVVNVEGQYMHIVNRNYISPHYIPVLRKSFNTITIEVKNDLNQPIPFEFGKTIVKLHFRRSIN